MIMIFLTLGREFKATFQRISRNPTHTLTAVFVMTLTFFVGASFIIFLLGAHVLLNFFESKPQVTAFLKDSATPTQVEEVKEILTSSGKIAKLRFVSKEEALNIYREQNKNEPILLEFVTASILPASLEVSATDVKFLPTIADILSKEKIVEEVIFQKDIVQTLTQWTNNIRNIGIAVTGALLLTSLLIMLTILGVSIASFKDEIEIMRLVGASSWYIRNPFIFEGIFYGLISSVLAVGGAYLLVYYLSPILQPFLSGIPLFPIPYQLYLYILGVEAAIGAFLGILVATVATWKHLRI